jgi:fructose-bisphosphate aldolase class II
MTLHTLHQLLHDAEKNSYAVGAFNVATDDMFWGVIDAAKAERAPVIVSIAEAHLPYLEWEPFMKMAKAACEAAPIPIALHLDHSHTFSVIVQACQLRFTSVMFDGSNLPYEENVEQTCKVVEVAHALGISVEAELGHVSGESLETWEKNPKDTSLTDPDMVVDFVTRTGIDALAVSIGTAHGYFKEEPRLRFELLKQIKKISPIPLVLHGGTGLSDDAFTEAIQNGIRKINYGTAVFNEAVIQNRRALDRDPRTMNYPAIQQEVRHAICRLISGYIRLWGGTNRSWIDNQA